MISEELADFLVGITKLASVTLVKNKYNIFFFHLLHSFRVTFVANGIVKLLNGGNNQLSIALLIDLISRNRCIGKLVYK